MLRTYKLPTLLQQLPAAHFLKRRSRNQAGFVMSDECALFGFGEGAGVEL